MGIKIKIKPRGVLAVFHLLILNSAIKITPRFAPTISPTLAPNQNIKFPLPFILIIAVFIIQYTVKPEKKSPFR